MSKVATLKTQKTFPAATCSNFEIRKDRYNRLSLWRNSEGEEQRLVSGAVWATGQARNAESAGWCHVIEFIDQDKKQQRWLMPRTLLAGDKTELLRQVLDRGLFISYSSKAKNDLVDYLSHATAERYTVVERTGWHSNSFVMATETIGNGDYILLNPTAAPEAKGSQQGWKENVAQYCVGNSRLVFSISTALASPLLELSGGESGGVHIVGKSSGGKTTTARVGRSIHGTGLQSWRATDNGLEGIAARSSDIGLILDDIGQIDPRLCGEVSYMLANGQGKARSRRNGSDRPAHTWRLIYMSTGEVSLKEHMESARLKAKAGQEVRLINIEADAGKGLGIFENLHGTTDGQDFVKLLETGINGHFGHTGPAFIRYIVENREHCISAIRDCQTRFITKARLQHADDGQVQRVATRFALIAAAGELATKAGLTDWSIDESINAAVTCFESWRKSWAPSGSREAEQAIEQVQSFIQEQASRFESLIANEKVPHNRAGYINKDEFWIFPNVFTSEVCKGLRPDNVRKTLIKARFLEIENDGKSAARRTVEGKRQRFYVIKKSILEDA